MKKRERLSRKRGLSAIVTGLLMILIALGAILIVWFFVRNIINQAGEEVDISKFTLSFRIKYAEVDGAKGLSQTLISREAGMGDVKAFKIILYDESGRSVVVRNDSSLGEFESRKLGAEYSLDELGEIVKVEIYPVLLLPSGKESIGGPVSTTNIRSVSIGTGEGGGEEVVCGDGFKDFSEECDDENTVDGDGCSAICKIEIGGEEPPVIVCGNGDWEEENGEGCDDGAGNGIVCTPVYGMGSCTYCSSSCATKVVYGGTSCGDGFLQGIYEECDDGNDINEDGCDSACKMEIPAVFKSNLLLVLKFEEATGQAVQNSISGGIGPFTANPESVSGAVAGSGKAIDFDRTGLTSGEYIVADGDLLKGKTAVSASLWFYMDGNAGQISHILFTDFVNSAQRFRIYLNSNRVIQVGVYDTSFRSRSTGQMVFNYGAWYHLVATADTNTDEIKIYLNGVEQSYTGLTPSLSAFYSPAVVGKVYVGAESASGTTVNSPYNGKVDEIYIWDKVLTQSEILELYNSRAGTFYGFTPEGRCTIDIPEFYAMFDAMDSETIFDDNNDGTVDSWENVYVESVPWYLSMTHLFSFPGQEGVRYNSNAINGLPALSFGRDEVEWENLQSMLKGNEPWFPTDGEVWTMFSVIKPDEVHGNPGVLFNLNPQGNFKVWLDPANNQYDINLNSQSRFVPYTQGAHILIMQYDGTNFKVWINGGSSVLSFATANPIGSMDLMNIGINQVVSTANFDLGEMVIFHKVLTASEMNSALGCIGGTWGISVNPVTI